MKKILLIASVFLSLLSIAQEYEAKKKSLPIIPLPREIKVSDGVFVLTSQTKIVLIADNFRS